MTQLYPERLTQITRVIGAFIALHNYEPDTVDMALHLGAKTQTMRNQLVTAVAQGAIVEHRPSPRKITYALAPVPASKESQMTQEEQLSIIGELSANVITSIVVDIKLGHVPADWDGWELRQLVADRFGRQTRLAENPKRMRAYKNTVLVKNL